MNPTLDQLLIVILGLNFLALGASRLRTVIRTVALQGALIGVLPLFVHHDLELHAVLLSLGTIVLKGFIVPAFLLYAKREVDIRHETQPTIGYTSSLVLGALGISFSVIFARTLMLEDQHKEMVLIPAASLATVYCGFLLLATRKMAINQVLGYLVLENGIFIFGMLLLEALPALVEIGALLDLFTAVFVMGIIIHHINREFASISTEHLTELKE